MMRKNSGWSLATVVSLAVAAIGSASAADMAVKARPMPAPPVVTYNWSGCYIGGNVGGSGERTDQSQIAKVDGTPVVPPNDFGSSTGTAVVGGGQIGCDYQFAGNWVVGLEGMFDFGKVSSQHFVPTAFPPFFPANAFSSTNSVKDVFTATARIGYLFAPSLLGYVKGGGAWAKVDHSIYLTVPVNSLSETAYGVTRQGWTVGGGLEWMFAPGAMTKLMSLRPKSM